MECTKWTRPDQPSKCTFDPKNKSAVSPHYHEELKKRPHIAKSVLELIGNTSLVHLKNISVTEGIECELLAKCEFMNPGGSVKDRIAVRMIEEGEKAGIYKPGDTLIEPTSGNTGIGLAMAAAVKGYKCIIVLPEKMSKEKCDVLRMLGAELVRTRTSAGFADIDSHIRIAAQIKQTIGETAHIPDQYTNPYNPIAHYDQTAMEILAACSEAGKPRVDMIVMGAGTGGTASGIARRIKLLLPRCKIVCVDPVGSNLADQHLGRLNTTGSYDVEGIGYDFDPTVIDKNVVDDWVRTEDKESFIMARRLIKQEGLLCGGSSGSAMVGALKAIKSHGLGKGDRVVVVLPDSVRNYMSKFLSDDWMFANNYLSYPEAETFTKSWFELPISELLIKVDILPLKRLEENYSVKFAILETNGQPAFVKKDSQIIGVFDPKIALTNLTNGSCNPSDSVLCASNKEFKQVNCNDPIGKMSRLLVYQPYVVVNRKEKEPVLVFSSDVLNFSMKKDQHN